MTTFAGDGTTFSTGTPLYSQNDSLYTPLAAVWTVRECGEGCREVEEERETVLLQESLLNPCKNSLLNPSPYSGTLNGSRTGHNWVKNGS